MVLRFFLFQAFILLFFVFGYFLRQKKLPVESTVGVILKLNLRILEPVIVLWSTWGLTLSFELIKLPLAGFVLVLVGFLAALPLLRFVKGDKRTKATFLIASSLANHGFTMGAFLSYIFFGESGLALASIFISYFSFYTYGIIFSYAGAFADGKSMSLKTLLVYLLKPHNLPLAAVIVAVLLQLAGIKRPAITLNLDFFILPAVSLYFFMLGLTFKASHLWNYIKETLLLSIIKFVVVPLTGLLFVLLVPMPFEYKPIILLESCMPAAVYSVVTANLFKLDTELASSTFVLNTVLFLILLALLFPLSLIFDLNKILLPAIF